MTLPNDVARCAGVGDDDEGWREGCEDCARRLAESTSAVSAWMLPPAIIAFWCEFRIAPSNVKVTGAPTMDDDKGDENRERSHSKVSPRTPEEDSQERISVGQLRSVC